MPAVLAAYPKTRYLAPAEADTLRAGISIVVVYLTAVRFTFGQGSGAERSAP